MTITFKPKPPIQKDSKLHKYWCQRYSLFSRYDDGIQLDHESWYSVTPENIAKHIARRMIKSLGDRELIIVDGFCGVGGNLIQFALLSPKVRVIGCDISLDKIIMARHNARIYGVEHQCEFILGNFLQVMRGLQATRVDAVFLSPPWGGVDYQSIKKYSLDSMNPNGYQTVNSVRKYLTDNIAFLMPRNVDQSEVRAKLLSKSHSICECEENMVGKKVKTITVYFGDLVDQSSETDSETDDTDS